MVTYGKIEDQNPQKTYFVVYIFKCFCGGKHPGSSSTWSPGLLVLLWKYLLYGCSWMDRRVVCKKIEKVLLLLFYGTYKEYMTHETERDLPNNVHFPTYTGCQNRIETLKFNCNSYR